MSPTPPLDFGTVAIGTSVDYGQTFTQFTNISITNNNPGTVTITSVAPQTAGDFTVTSNTCTGALAAGNSCTFDVVFAPTVNTPETNNIQISYTGANSASSPFSVAVKGTGSNSVVATPNPFNISTPSKLCWRPDNYNRQRLEFGGHHYRHECNHSARLAIYS